MAIDPQKLDEFIGRFVTDFSAFMHGATVIVGDKLGLYKALAEGPTTGADLAARTGFDRRLVEEWLAAQFVSGYAEHDPEAGTFWLTEEQAAVLADATSPAHIIGAFTVGGSMVKDEELVRERFATGRLGWGEHHHDLFAGTERLFKPGYLANLTQAWIPALDGVEAKLQAGATVADVGCGYGASTIVMAEAYPASTFVGFDSHPDSVDTARKRAAEAGVGDRVRFEVGSAQDFPGTGYDLVCVFDALHDMGDPTGAAGHIRQSLAADGTWMVVEPMAGASLADNVNPVGRIFYSASPMICTPSAQAQDGGYALGNQVPDAVWERLLTDEGFTRFRRATETPFNRVFELRP